MQHFNNPRTRIECESAMSQLKIELLELQQRINTTGVNRNELKAQITQKTQQLLALKGKLTAFYQVEKKVKRLDIDEKGMELLVTCHRLLATIADQNSEVIEMIERLNRYFQGVARKMQDNE